MNRRVDELGLATTAAELLLLTFSYSIVRMLVGAAFFFFESNQPANVPIGNVRGDSPALLVWGVLAQFDGSDLLTAYQEVATST